MRDIQKGAVALVAVEAHGGLWLLALPRPLATVDQQNIEPAIPIIIKKSSASAHGFWVPLFASGPGFMAKDHPGCCSDVGKLEGCRRRR